MNSIEGIVASTVSDAVVILNERIDRVEAAVNAPATVENIINAHVSPGAPPAPITTEPVEHNVKPILLNDNDRIELEAYLGQNIDDPKHLLKLVHRLCTIKFIPEGAEQMYILVNAEVLDRLDGRKPPDTTMQEFINEIFLDEIERFIGLR